MNPYPSVVNSDPETLRKVLDFIVRERQSDIAEFNQTRGIARSTSTAAVAHQWINAISSAGIASLSQPAASDLSDYATGTWTPTDASGAALALTTANGRYTRIGRMLFCDFVTKYPATVDASHATIGGLPFVCGTDVVGGLALSFVSAGIGITAQANSAAATFSLYNLSGGNVTNANMTGAFFEGVFIYNA